MSIENTLERIATALETIAKVQTADTLTVAEATTALETIAKVQTADTLTVAEATEAVTKAVGATSVREGTPSPSAPVAAAPVAAAPVAAAPVAAAPVAAAPVAAMTPEELNAALVVEFKRLGGRELIDEVMTKQFNIQSINDLAAEQRGALITAVKALAKV